MKFHDNGSLYSVSISTRDVEAFKAQWPCNGMPSRPLWVQFDKRNGDLVDLRPSNWEERGAGGAAMLALIEDAQDYAVLRNPPDARICYPCADKREREELRDRSKPFTAYVSSDAQSITSWTGGALMRITQTWTVRLARWSHWHGQSMLAIRATDCHGGRWYGRGSPGVAINLRACKG